MGLEDARFRLSFINLQMFNVSGPLVADPRTGEDFRKSHQLVSQCDEIVERLVFRTNFTE